MSDLRARTARAALAGLAVGCALGTFASEVTTGFAVAVTLVVGRWGRGGVVGGGATWAWALVWVLMVPVSGNLREGLGHVWPVAPLFVVPTLLKAARSGEGRTGAGSTALATAVRAGLIAAALLGAEASVEGCFREAQGPFSHHLTLAYVLLPPLGVALQRRSALAFPIALGVLGSRASGALFALPVTVLLGVWAARDATLGRVSSPRRSGLAALLGMLLTAFALPLGDAKELGERAVLWTGGLELGLGAAGPAGPGGYPAASAPLYNQLQSGFWFPNHAHDSATQALAVLGPAGWLVGLAFVAALFDAFGGGAAAGLAGVCIGSLTQDNFGDLEVIRSVVIWGAIAGARQTFTS